MTFFQKSAGQWKSQRTTHHLPFRRAETGDSEIYVEALSADNPKIIAICEMHEVDPAKTVGGAFVSWDGSMQWDKENENHQGTTVFALIPDEDNPQAGVLLRERGYAEIIPVAGRYHIDEQEGLVFYVSALAQFNVLAVLIRPLFVLNPAISHRSQSLVIPPNHHPIRLVAGKFSYQLSVISYQLSVISYQLFSPISLEWFHSLKCHSL